MQHKNIKFLKESNRDTESPYIMYRDADNLYAWSLSQTLPVGGFEWKKNTSKFNKNLIKDYNGDSDIKYILELDVECPKRLYNLHNDLPFLPEKIDIKKFYKLVCNLHN